MRRVAFIERSPPTSGVEARFSCRRILPASCSSKPNQSSAESWRGPHSSGNRCHPGVFLFFHNCGPMIFAIKLPIAGTDLGIKKPSHHPAPLSAALVKVDRSVNRSRWTEGLLVQSGRTAGRLWRTPEMVSTSVTRPIVVGHQPNPKFAIHLDPLPRANAASKPRGRTSSSLTIPGKSASFYRWLRAMAHAAFVRNKTGEDLTSLSSTSPERTMSHWPPIEEHLWWTVITSTNSGSNQRDKK